VSEEELFPGYIILQIQFFGFFFQWFVKYSVYHEEVQYMNELCDRIMPLMVGILRSAEHIKNLRGPVFENLPISPVHFVV
jgi:hypothetical protein